MDVDCVGLYMEEIDVSQECLGCAQGDCIAPATRRLYEDYVLCSLHALSADLSNEMDRLDGNDRLLRGWNSQAKLLNQADPIRSTESLLEENERLRALAEKRFALVMDAAYENEPKQHVELLRRRSTSPT